MSRGRKVRPADMRRALQRIANFDTTPDFEFDGLEASETMGRIARDALRGNAPGTVWPPPDSLLGSIIQYERAERDTWTIACDCAWCRENDARADSGAYALARIGEALTVALRAGFCTTCETWSCGIPVWDPAAYWRRPYLRDFDRVTTNVVEPRHRIPIDALTSEWDDRPSHGMFCSCHECDW